MRTLHIVAQMLALIASVIIGLVSILLLVAEGESILWILGSKILAVIGLIISYYLLKWVQS